MIALEPPPGKPLGLKPAGARALLQILLAARDNAGPSSPALASTPSPEGETG